MKEAAAGEVDEDVEENEYAEQLLTETHEDADVEEEEEEDVEEEEDDDDDDEIELAEDDDEVEGGLVLVLVLAVIAVDDDDDDEECIDCREDARVLLSERLLLVIKLLGLLTLFPLMLLQI